MSNLLAKQRLIKLQLLGVVAIIVFMFIPSTFGCVDFSVTLYTGASSADALLRTDQEVSICKGDAAYFCAQYNGARPDYDKLGWQIDYGNGDGWETKEITTYDAAGDYKIYLSPTSTKSDVYDENGEKTPKIRVFYVNGSNEPIDKDGNVVGDSEISSDDVSAKDDENCKVYVVEVDTIEYEVPPDSDTWVDATTSTLYVFLGTTVDLKAIPDPEGASWPSGKPVWGGTSGASGTGATTSVTFNTGSSSSTDYKTVTAECGNTVTVNVVVYHFALDIDEADDFTGRSHTKLGIEEEVELKYSMDPSSVTASQAGGLEWTKSGLGTITNAGLDGIADYDADEIAGGTPSDVILTLTVDSGPSKGEYQWCAMEIIAPTGTRMTLSNPGTVRHDKGDASAGIGLYYWLDPKDVSFSNLEFGEGSCPATGKTNIYVTSPPGDHAQNYFGAIGNGDSTNGCKVSGMDGAWSTRNPWTNGGTYNWVIPAHYIDNRGDPAGRVAIGSTETHSPTLQANGDAQMDKGGQSGSAKLNDEDSWY